MIGGFLCQLLLKDHASAGFWLYNRELAIPIILHERRHTFGSLLIDAGANPKAIQAFMGHSKIQATSISTATCSPAVTTRCANGWMST